jgi:hypothetical protein
MTKNKKDVELKILSEYWIQAELKRLERNKKMAKYMREYRKL